MATFLWACFDGGGNVPPSVGIARELTVRGHEVAFAGRPEMVPRIREVGLTAVEVTHAYTNADAYAWHPRGQLYAYLTAPVVAEELLGIAAERHPDVVVIDAMFGAALGVAPKFGVPTAVMLHTFLHRTIDGWYVMMDGQSEARQRCGFDPLPPIEELWGGPDRFQVNSFAALDAAPRLYWPNIHHGGPILEHDGRAVPVATPWPADDPTPRAVVSFSTAVAQRSLGKLQRTLDACAAEPVHVVATTGGAIERSELTIPGNAHVVRFATHEPLMRGAALVVTHGGHGTVMRALSLGVPVVCLAGQAADQEGVAALDQPCVAAFLAERGVGRALPADAPATNIRAAVREVLGDPAYRENAQAMAAALPFGRGAADAADGLEALLP
jgi:UDP:flavonoid glycosyltransferase YjiC (YdhE family)